MVHFDKQHKEIIDNKTDIDKKKRGAYNPPSSRLNISIIDDYQSSYYASASRGTENLDMFTPTEKILESKSKKYKNKKDLYEFNFDP
jgi:hypothetical protein